MDTVTATDSAEKSIILNGKRWFLIDITLEVRRHKSYVTAQVYLFASPGQAALPWGDIRPFSGYFIQLYFCYHVTGLLTVYLILYASQGYIS